MSELVEAAFAMAWSADMSAPGMDGSISGNTFVSRCMSDKVMQEYEQEQRAGICYTQWRRRNKVQEGEEPMRLYGAIEKVEPLDDGTVKVHGIASTEAEDDQGEVVKSEAMRAAIPDYMRFPAIREMHQLSAAGTALEIDVGDDSVTRLVAHIVDPIAVAKVKNQVYRGFSIGGKVTKREAGAPKIITGLSLTEISLVDRPANPEAIFDMWKAANPEELAMRESRSPEAIRAERSAAPFNAPIQIWACGNPEHRHIAKGDAVKCLEKRHTISAETDEVLAEKVQAFEARTQAARAAMSVEPLDRQSVDQAAAKEKDARRAVETTEGLLVALDRRGDDKPGAEERHLTVAEQRIMDNALRSSLTIVEKGGDAPGDGDKPYGDVKYADPGYQSDGKKRYPIDTEKHIRAAWNYINKPKNAGKYSPAHAASIKSRIVAAWKDKIDPAGPPSASGSKKSLQAAFRKALEDVGPVAMVIRYLDELCEQLEYEAEVEGDESSLPAKMHGIVGELCSFLRDLAAEETSEIESGDEIEPQELGMPMAMAATAAGERSMEKRSMGDQHLMDVAHAAIHKALSMDGMSSKERGHMVQAREAMKEAAAGPGGSETWQDGHGTTTEHATQDTGRNPSGPAPDVSSAESHSGVDRDPTGSPGGKASQTEMMLELIADALGKRSMGHQHLMDVAHHCVAKLTDGATCKDDAGKAGGRHDQGTLDHLHKAHYHLVSAGAKCDAMKGAAAGGLPDEHQGTKFSAAGSDDLAKALAGQSEALTKTLGMLDALAKDVAAIKAQPLPPVTMAKGSVAVDKIADGAAEAERAADAEIRRAWDAMSPDERSIALIKGSYRNPFIPMGGANAQEIRSGQAR